MDGLTIIRLRGFTELQLTSVGSPGDGFSGALGIGIVTEAAFDIGISAMPTPVTEVEWEGWMYHQWFSLHASDTALDVPPLSFQIDSKAMRKFGSDMTIFAAIETDFEDGAAVLDVRFATRMLLKLP